MSRAVPSRTNPLQPKAETSPLTSTRLSWEPLASAVCNHFRCGRLLPKTVSHAGCAGRIARETGFERRDTLPCRCDRSSAIRRFAGLAERGDRIICALRQAAAQPSPKGATARVARSQAGQRHARIAQAQVCVRDAIQGRSDEGGRRPLAPPHGGHRGLGSDPSSRFVRSARQGYQDVDS